MTEVVLGTAHLFGEAVDEATSRSVLNVAWDLGVRRFDTAPSYGHGRSEAAVAGLVRGGGGAATVTTKVGIEPVAPATRGVRLIKGAARRLPQPVQRRLRGAGPRGGGHFELDEVRRSVDRSLSRLPHLDRLLLHEVQPEDITPELIACLRDYLDSGRVGRAGVATSNEHTAACIARARDVLTVAHVAVGLHADVPELGGGVLTVGHGALGPGGSDLHALTERWTADPRRSSSGHALVAALITRALAHGPDELIVATSRPERVGPLVQLVREAQPAEPEMVRVLDELRAAGLRPR